MDKGGRSYRFNMRADPEWVDRVRAEAKKLGISMADFVVMVVNERLGVRAEPEPPAAGPRRRKRKE
jgi:hypothetical protein